MDVFEDKDSTETTGSLAETESPPMSRGDGGGVLPELMNMVTAAATTATAGGGGVVMNSGSVKKKRGRPRKYDADGNLRAPYNSAGFSSSTPKRGRGRPSGSGNCQIFASLGEIFASTAGGDFTPHVVTVYAGEDVAGKILSFVQKGSRGMCVLSANGPVSNVTISQPGSSGKILTYEGRFEILSLTGSFTTSENGGIKSGTGGLSVSLAGPDGRVIGGGVAGLLMAASPIQIVVGNFMPNGYCQKPQKRKYTTEPKTAPVILGSPDPISVLARPSQAAAPPESTPPSGLSKKESANSTATNTAPTLGLNISIMLLCIMF